MTHRSEIPYFSQHELWSRNAVSEQLAVADDLIALIPDDVSNILDAGCGNGTVTNKLFPRWNVIGCDISESAIMHVEAPALIADLCAIPFADKHFDLTLSSDVIEHLPDLIYPQALQEIARVSARYILVAVPYRELLEGAVINCPACGHLYHAHLHQRAYTVADVVSLFAPEFTAIDIRFSGERWTFSDPELLKLARQFSGLDYPFEEGICPQCGTRRGTVEQSDRAQQVYRQFESLQAMLVAEGLRESPSNSEILVLFKRNAQDEQCTVTPGPARLGDELMVRVQGVIERADPINYSSGAYRVQSEPDYCLLVLTRRPPFLRLTSGHFESLEIYDHVRARYVPVASAAQSIFELPAVPFGPHGCILRIRHPGAELGFELAAQRHDLLDVVDCCLGDDPVMAQIKEDSARLLALAESLEAARHELEIRAQNKEKEFNALRQSAIRANELANRVERKRADIEACFTQASEMLTVKERQLNEQCQTIETLYYEQRRLTSECIRLSNENALFHQSNNTCHLQLENTTLKLERLQAQWQGQEHARVELEDKSARLSARVNELSVETNEQRVLIDALNIHLGAISLTACGMGRKVLVVSHMYPSESNQVGGIFVHEQVKALRAQGVDARVVSGEPFWINTLNPVRVKRALGIYSAQHVDAWEHYDSVPVIRFPYLVSGALPFQTHATTYTHGLMRQAKWIHADFSFELVHAHTAYTDGTAGRRLARKFKVPLVITEHTGPFALLTRTPYLRHMTQKALNAADAVVAVSSALFCDIKNQIRLYSPARLSVIANLVNTEFFLAQTRQRDHLIHMLWVGHFVPVKRVPVLIDAFAQAFNDHPHLRLRLAGDGEGINEAQQRVNALGLDHVVEFVGAASREQLVNYYRECDFLVISSESETFGVVAIEAMSCGRPVLTSRCGGPEDVVTHPLLGLTVGLSVEELAEGMREMVNYRDRFDERVIRKLTELRFSAPRIADRLIALYSAVMDGRRDLA